MAMSVLRLFLAVPVLGAAIDVDGEHGDLSPGVSEPRQAKLMRQEMRAHHFQAMAATEEGVAASLLQRGANDDESTLGVGSETTTAVPDPNIGIVTDGLTVNASNVMVTKDHDMVQNCAEVVRVEADELIKDVHPLATGIYHLIKTDVTPPIYINSNHQFYMYYVQKNKMWRIGKHYTNIAAAISSNPATEALCPTEVENWYAFDPNQIVTTATAGANIAEQQWTTKYQIRVNKEECAYQVKVQGAEDDHQELMGTFSMLTFEKDNRPVYHNQNGKFFRYCAALEAWRIGSNADSCGAGVASNATAKTQCPTSPEAWCVWKNNVWTPKEIVVEKIDPVTHDAKNNLVAPHNGNTVESAEGVPVPNSTYHESAHAEHGPGEHSDHYGEHEHDHEHEHDEHHEHIPAEDHIHGDRAGMENSDYHFATLPVDHHEDHEHEHDHEHDHEHEEHDHHEHEHFVFAEPGSVDCPVDAVDMTLDECREAAEEAGMHFVGESEHDDMQSGCVKSVMIGEHHEEEDHDNHVMFNTHQYGEPNHHFEKICRRAHAGEHRQVHMMSSAHVATTTAAAEDQDVKAADNTAKSRKRKAAFMAGGIFSGLLTVCCICGCIFLVRGGKKKEAEAAKEPLAPAGEARTPTQGDYVLVISQNRKGWVAAMPDDQWRYTVTFEDDNTTSEPLPFEDIQLIEDPAAAGGEADAAKS